MFLAVYLITANITAAAAVAITIGLAQIAMQRFTGRRIWPMQWISILVVIVLSAASIVTQSPRFVMLKPSLGHFAIAAAMLKRGWMSRYLPEIALRYLPDNVPVVLGGVDGGARPRQHGDRALGPLRDLGVVHSMGAIGAKVAAFVLQYAVFRTMIRRARRRAEGAAIGAAARPSSALLGMAAGLILVMSSGGAGAVGLQRLAIPDPEGAPLEVDVWYPSEAPVMSRSLGPFRQTVAGDGAIVGSQLPLIVISHGTGGGAETHYVTIRH